jgi:maltose/maltodextrin transport system substrate-binding protein
MRPERGALALLIGCACTRGGAAAPAPLRLLVWINGDKGYNGLQKVGDAFTRSRRAGGGAAPRRRAGQVQRRGRRRQGAGHLLLAARPRRRMGQVGLIVPVKPGQARARRDRRRGLEGLHLPRPGLGLPAGHRGHRPDLQQGTGADAAGQLRRVIALDKRLAAQGKQGHPVGLQQELLHLAHAGRAGRLCLRPHAQGDSTPRWWASTPRRAGRRADARAPGPRRPHAQGRALRRDGRRLRARPGGDDDLRPLGLGQRAQGGIDFGVAPIPSVAASPASPSWACWAA